MQTKNNYDITCKKSDGVYELGVFNGDIGVISLIDQKNRQLYVEFDDRTAYYDFSDLSELELAYAVTVHKSQGSEFDVVLLVLSDMTPLLQYRNLLYTAVTRAKQLLVVVGNDQVIKNMVQNNKRSNRYSGLKHLIIKYFDYMK
jgi:exodeoxyribonuclease V alpha subunit